MRKNILFVLMIFGLFASSCVSNKKFILVQNKQETFIDTSQYIEPVVPEYRLQVGDILFVQIKSQDILNTTLFNVSGNSTGQEMGNQGGNGGMVQSSNGNAFYLSGYTIDQDGKIDLPTVGKIKVAGLSQREVQSLVEKEASTFFINKNYYVVVKLSGIPFSILGEVNFPGQRQVFQTKMSLLEAIANAGDLTPIADRQNVMIIRQYPEGSKVHTLDLTDLNSLKSPYYFVQPNDIIYIKPVKARVFSRSSNVQESLVPLFQVVSAVSTITNLILINFLRLQ